MEAAVELVRAAIDAKRRITVHATSTSTESVPRRS